MKGTRADRLALGLLLALLSTLLCANAMRVFDFFDMSAFMDAGYRVWRGQRPYTDFYFNAGPVHLYLHALFFTLFGFSKEAILAHLCVVNGVVTAVAFYIGRRHLPRMQSVLVAFVVSLCFYGPISHPWYDQNAHLWLVIGVGLLEIELTRQPARGALPTGAACGVLAALAFLTKANIGVAGAVLFFACMVAAPRRAQLLAGYLLGGIVGGLLLLLLLTPPREFIYQTLIAYKPSSRFADTVKLRQVLRDSPHWLLACLTAGIAVLGGPACFRRELPRYALFSGLLFCSVFSVWTGSMLPAANIPLLGLEVLLLSILASRLSVTGDLPRSQRFGRQARTACLLIASAFGLLGAQRTYALETWRWRPSNHFQIINNYALQVESFAGWRCNRAIGEGLDRAIGFINESVPKKDSLFVFPDATIAYGLTHRESYRGAPFIFHVGQFPAPGRMYDDFRALFLRNPPQWILLHNQVEVNFYATGTLLEWLGLEKFLRDDYEMVWRFGDFLMLHQKPRAASRDKIGRGDPHEMYAAHSDVE